MAADINVGCAGWLALLVVATTLQPRTASSAPASVTPAPAPQKLLAAAFAGIHSVRRPFPAWHLGTRFGALVGYRFRPWFSLNSELAFDVFDPVSFPEPMVISYTAQHQLDLALSPLLHLRRSRWELALGPKLGRFWSRTWLQHGTDEVRDRDSGWVLGLNAGAFARLPWSVSAGLLASYVFRIYEPSCRDYPDGTTLCNQGTPPPDEIA
jgi:hypothetical protein